MSGFAVNRCIGVAIVIDVDSPVFYYPSIHNGRLFVTLLLWTRTDLRVAVPVPSSPPRERFSTDGDIFLINGDGGEQCSFSDCGGNLEAIFFSLRLKR